MASTACDVVSESGQSTVEYAVVLAGFLALVVGLGSLWDCLSGGVLVEHAVTSASHQVSGVVTGVVGDVFLP